MPKKRNGSSNKNLSKRGKDSCILVNSTKIKAGKRIVSIDHSLLNVLNDWKENIKIRQQVFNIETPDLFFFNKEGNYVSPTSTKTWLRSIYHHYPELKKISAHGFRHTHVTAEKKRNDSCPFI